MRWANLNAWQTRSYTIRSKSSFLPDNSLPYPLSLPMQMMVERARKVFNPFRLYGFPSSGIVWSYVVLSFSLQTLLTTNESPGRGCHCLKANLARRACLGRTGEGGKETNKKCPLTSAIFSQVS